MTLAKQRQRFARFAAMACVFSLSSMLFAGEKEDSSAWGPSENSFLPMKNASVGGAVHVERHSVTAIKHGFGNFVLQKDSFIERILPFEDGACRTKIDKNIREIVFLEFRQKLQMQKLSGEWSPSLEVEKMLRVLGHLQTNFQPITRSIASSSVLTQEPSFQEKAPHSFRDYSSIKSWQVEAQANPDSVIRQCHAELLFAKVPKDELRESFKVISKCRIEEDSSCHQKWIEYCPTYKIEYLGSLSGHSRNADAPQPVLCKKALEAIVADFESPLF